MPLRLDPASGPPDGHPGAAAAEGGAGSRSGQEHGELPPNARPFPRRLHRPAHGHEVSVRAGLETWGGEEDLEEVLQERGARLWKQGRAMALLRLAVNIFGLEIPKRRAMPL